MRLLVTGAAGQLGSELAQIGGDHKVTATTRDDLDITDPDAVARVVGAVRPDVVLNCAAYNAVDQAESEPEVAMAVNAEGPGHLARACAALGAHLVHFSTDYVFDGTKDTPYLESDVPNPLSEYARSKLAGERAVASGASSWAVVRTAWVFGRRGRSLVETILSRTAAELPLRMVDDQRGSPTSALDLAAVAIEIATRRLEGLFHVTNAGECTPYTLALDVLRIAGLDGDAFVERTDTEAFGSVATRPRYSVLRSERLAEMGIPDPRHYRDALEDLVPQLLPVGRDA